MTDVKIEELQADSIKTSDPVLNVSQDDGTLPVGQHQVELVVADDSGNVSVPAVVSVVIVDTGRPTAVIDVRDAQGRLVTNGRVPHGQAFRLDASRSADTGGGSIESYTWRLIS